MMKILVTGATGYIGGKLIAPLLARGYSVRVLARSPQKLASRSWRSRVEVVQGDALQPDSLVPAMKGIDAAYYLIHNMTLGRGYTEMEIRAARNFAQAAEAASVKIIIYLGGLADSSQDLSPHMRARIETGAALRSGSVPVTEFRAGVIVGSGSASFEMIRFVAEFMPVIPGPLWLNNKAQPIAAQNVIDYLIAALERPEAWGQVFEIGGPSVATYRELMEGFARARGLKRKFILLPFLPIELMALGVDLFTPIPRPVARALIGGLSRDSVMRDTKALEVYPVRPMELTAAAREALKSLHPRNIERVWEGDLRGLIPFKHEGFFIDQRGVRISAPPEKVLQTLSKLNLPGFKLESAIDSAVLFRSTETRSGSHWLEYRAETKADAARLTQTSYFAPRGSLGFLRGYAGYFWLGRLFTNTLKALRVALAG